MCFGDKEDSFKFVTLAKVSSKQWNPGGWRVTLKYIARPKPANQTY